MERPTSGATMSCTTATDAGTVLAMLCELDDRGSVDV